MIQDRIILILAGLLLAAVGSGAAYVFGLRAGYDAAELQHEAAAAQAEARYLSRVLDLNAKIAADGTRYLAEIAKLESQRPKIVIREITKHAPFDTGTCRVSDATWRMLVDEARRTAAGHRGSGG